MKNNKHFIIVRPLIVLTILLLSITANAQKEKLQTAFIYQLTRLVEWCPEGKEGNFVIAVVGNDPELSNQLLALQVRRVGNQKVEIRSYPDASKVGKANILFVTNDQFDNVNKIAENAGGACTLIISDFEAAAKKDAGAGVSLVYNVRAEKIEFYINRNYMKDKSFNVNSQLYDLASRVY